MPLAHRKKLPCRRFRGPRCRWSYLPCPQCGQGAEKKLPCPQCAYGAEKDSVPTARKKIARPGVGTEEITLYPVYLQRAKELSAPLSSSRRSSYVPCPRCPESFWHGAPKKVALSPVLHAVPSSACQFCMQQKNQCPVPSSDRPRLTSLPTSAATRKLALSPMRPMRKRLALSPGKGLPCPQWEKACPVPSVWAPKRIAEGAFEVRDALWSDGALSPIPAPTFRKRGEPKTCPVPGVRTARKKLPCPQYELRCPQYELRALSPVQTDHVSRASCERGEPKTCPVPNTGRICLVPRMRKKVALSPVRAEQTGHPRYRGGAARLQLW